MPRKEFHDIFEEAVLGKITGMSEIMDAPSKQLKGHHRVLFHDPIQVGIIAMAKGGDVVENMIAGMLHLALDNSLSDGKKALKKYNKQKRNHK